MALNFPLNPQTGSTHTDSNLVTWEYTGKSWRVVSDTLPSEISFKASVDTTNTTLVTGTTTQIVFDTLEYEHGLSGFNTGTSTYVCRRAGRYHFDISILVNSPVTDTSRFDIRVYKNSVIVESDIHMTSGTTFHGMSTSCDLSLSVGDELYVGVNNGSGSDESLYVSGGSEDYSWWSGHYIGAMKGDDGDLGAIVYNDEISFNVGGSAQTAVAAGSDVKVIFSTENSDLGNGFDLTNSKFVAPVAGTYLFKYAVGTATAIADTKDIRVSIYKNGAFQETGDKAIASGSHSYMVSNGVSVLSLDKDDYVEIYCKHNHTSTIDFDQYVKFSGYLISPAVVLAPVGVEHAFSVHKNGTDQTPSIYDDWVKVTWSTAEKLTNVDFDFTNSKFVIPTTGWWSFTANVQFNGLTDGESYRTALYVDGSIAKQLESSAAGTTLNLRQNGSVDMYLTAGQEVEVYAWHGGASADVIEGTANQTFFSGKKLSGTSTGVEHDRYEVGFRAYVSSNQDISNNTTTVVDFDTLTYDRGGNFDTTNNRFVAPVDGLYTFAASFNFAVDPAADGTQISSLLYINGSNYGVLSRDWTSSSTAGAWFSLGGSQDAYLSAGDTVDVRILSNTGQTDTVQSSSTASWFVGHLVQADAKAECSFMAYMSANDNTSSGAGWKQVLLDSVRFDYGNNFDTTNNKFVVPEDGRYMFHMSVSNNATLSAQGIRWQCAAYKNGALDYAGQVATGETSYTGWFNSTGEYLADLEAGDEITLYVYSGESTAETIAGGNNYWTYLSGYRLVTVPAATDTYNPVVWEYEVTGSAVQQIDVPSYLLGEKQYRLEANIIHGSTSASTVALYINGDTTNTNYYTQQLRGSNTTVSGDRFNYSQIAYSAGNATDSHSRVTCNMGITDNDLISDHIETRITSGLPIIFSRSLANVATSFSAITAIRIYSTTSNAFGVGTRIRILKD